MIAEVSVLGCGAYVPGFAGLRGWAESVRIDAHDVPSGEMVPPRQRRRTSPLTRAVADAFFEALGGTSLDPATIASVFGSAIGEASTMIGLLDQMWSETASLSPMKFATSVHNAASGVISIATANRSMTTAIGADYDTPAMALLEGIGLVLARGDSVVVCCGDEAPPPDLVAEGVGWSMLAAAIVLGPTSQAPKGSPRLSQFGIAASTSKVRDIIGGNDSLVERNPNIGLLDLAVSIQSGAEGVVALDRGAGRGYSVRVQGANA